VRVTPGAVGLVMAIGPIGPLPSSDFSTVATAAAVMQCAHGIFWVHGRIDQGNPRGIVDGVLIAVDVAVADCGDRTPEVPEVISVLGVEYRDVGVGSCHVSEREQPGIFDQTELLGNCESADHRIPGRRASDDRKCPTAVCSELRFALSCPPISLISL